MTHDDHSAVVFTGCDPCSPLFLFEKCWILGQINKIKRTQYCKNWIHINYLCKVILKLEISCNGAKKKHILQQNVIENYNYKTVWTRPT